MVRGLELSVPPPYLQGGKRSWSLSSIMNGEWCNAAAAKSLQLCPTLCDPIDGLPPGSPVPGILQARTLEWVAISFSNAWNWKVKVKSPLRVRLLANPWTAAYQAPPSMGFSRQEYWSGVPFAFSEWSPHKYPKGVQSFQAGEHVEMWRELCVQRWHRSSSLFPRPWPMHLLHLAVPE